MNVAPTKSRFYGPSLEILQANAPKPMGVNQIIKAVAAKYPDKDWRSCNGGVRAILIKMAANDESPIKQVENSELPLFFVEKSQRGTVMQHHSAADCTSSEQTKATSNSMFYKPCCELLKACAPRTMSANDLMKAIITDYPDLEWSHSQGPVRAMLIKAASQPHSPIQCKENTQPPQFYYQAAGASNDIKVEASADEIMGNAFAKTQTALKEALMEKIKSLDPTAFEHLANRLVAKMLFGEAEDTQPSGDGGLDGYVHIYADPLGLNEIGIQAKHYKAGENVQRPEIQQFIGALTGRNGVCVTCSDYAPNAKKAAERATPNKIVCINGAQLIEYMIKFKVGVRETGISYTLAEVDKEFFEEL